MDDTAGSGVAGDDAVTERTTEDLRDGERTTEDLLDGTVVDSAELDRWQAAKYVAPFLFIGLFDLVLLLGWGLDPLWGFMILPPILFVSVLAWIAFRTGFASDRVDAD